MNILIERIPNKPVDSNSFVVYSDNNVSCIIIDPGTKDCNNLIEFINKEKLIPEYVILTHEHFDHIWGVDKLKDIYGVQLICSSDCASGIVNKKRNMSVFYNQVGFETYPPDILLEDIKYKLTWNNINFEFISTPGHTDASICLLIGDNLFTGDTIIKNTKTVIKLPGGNKVKLQESLLLLKTRFSNKVIMIHSGHGKSFRFNESEIERCI